MGDHFINDIYHGLQYANQDKVKDQNKKLYLNDTYNVRCFSSHLMSKIKEAPARLVKVLIHGLNEKRNVERSGQKICECQLQMPAALLPRYIIIVPDWDIVKHIGHYHYGVSIMIQKVMSWINRAIMTRKDDLSRAKAGTTSHSESKIVWIAMIDRVGCQDWALSIRNKFNSILETILADFDHHYIANINKPLSDSSFFSGTTLATSVTLRYWLEVDKIIKEFDTHNISLRPIKASDKPDQKLKMPPPSLTQHWKHCDSNWTQRNSQCSKTHRHTSSTERRSTATVRYR